MTHFKSHWSSFLLGIVLSCAFAFREHIFFSIKAFASEILTISIEPVDGDVTASNLDSGVITKEKLAQNSATNGQVLKWSSGLGRFIASDDSGATPTGGTLFSLTPGSGFTSSTAITTSGTLNLNVGSTANKIVQLNASGQLPAVSGADLTAIPADATFDLLSVWGASGVSASGELRFYELTANGSHYIALKGQDNLANNQILTLEATSDSNLTLDSSNTSERKLLMVDSSGDLKVTSYPEYFNRQLNKINNDDYPTEVYLYAIDNFLCITTDTLADYPNVIEIESTNPTSEYYQVFFDAGGGASEPTDQYGPILIPGKTIHVKTRVKGSTQASSRSLTANTYNDQWYGGNAFVYAGGAIRCMSFGTYFWPSMDFTSSFGKQYIHQVDPSFKARGWK